MADLKLIKPLGVQNIINKFCLTIGMIPSSYKLSLTYEEQILSIGKYLEETVIPALNNNAEAVAELQALFVQLKDYVENYFDNLDVQNEVNAKLDEMANSGKLAEIINEEIFGELNEKINNNTQEINEFKNYPYFDILKNGGFADGITPNDNLFNTAKNQGYKKFYFSQNENNNANYYFENIPLLNECEILNDNNVIINLPHAGGIDNTKNCIFNNNIIFNSRENNIMYVVPKNTPDFFNSLQLQKDYSFKKMTNYNVDSCKLFKYDYFGTKLFVDDDLNKSNKYVQSNNMIQNKNNDGSYFALLCVPLKEDNECIEVVSNGGGAILNFGILNSQSGNGIYGQLDNEQLKYFNANGVSENIEYGKNVNIFTNSIRDNINYNYQLPFKYKLKYKKDKGGIEVFINDIYAGFLYDGISNPDYFGFGFSSANLTEEYKFSNISYYKQIDTPINSNLKILLAGDSRCYGYNETYRIEKVIENGLKLNGINKVEIDNISVSGWTINDIYNAITSRNLSQYDVVIIASGINNYIDSFDSIAGNFYNLLNHITSNKCICIVPATIPTTQYTDLASLPRTQQYYKIQNAITLACASAFDNKVYISAIDNICGITLQQSNLEITSDGVHPNNYGMIEFAKSITLFS